MRSLRCFQLTRAQTHIWNVVVIKCALVCDIRLLRFARVLMTSLTMTTHCWGHYEEKGF